MSVQQIRQSDIATWPDEYESILEFYFWEPQHLNRFSPPPDRRKALNTVLEHLRAKEVPLNHLFSIFFSLAPAALSARLISAIAPDITSSSADLINSSAFRRSKLRGICQPDLLLIVDGRPVFLELKLQAKTSKEQLLKYALAGETIGANRDTPPALVLVGRSAKFAAADIFEREREAGSLIVPAKIERRAFSVDVSPERLVEAARRMPIFRASYADIRNHLLSELETISTEVEGGQTLRKLVVGMVYVLERLKP